MTMNKTLAEFQKWLNNHGAQPLLVEDGLAGPVTRSAIIETFRNTDAPGITPEQEKQIADAIPISLRQLRAIAITESAGGGWDSSGLLKALWERHYAWRRIRFVIPGISNPKSGGYTVDADRDGINDSWEKLADMALRFPKLAFECASFGKFQIMGAHWKALNYSSAWEMVWRFSRTEMAHYQALARFIITNDLVQAAQRIDGNPANCERFTLGYNGKYGIRNGYHGKIARAFRVQK